MDVKYVFIACAMNREAKPIIDKMNDVNSIEFYGFNLSIGKIEDKDVIVGISGPGLINMSSLVSVVSINFELSCIINYGMVGGFGSIHKNSLIIGTECMNANSYVTSYLDKGVDINKWDYITFSDGGEDKLVVYESNKKLIDISKNINYVNDIYYGRIGSGDIWLNEQERIKLLMDKYLISCEDMEAVAMYQIASKYNIDCISIKGVSDNFSLNEKYDDSVIPLLVDYVYAFVLNIN